MLKKAMIMSAGVGSRLGPLSSVFPKPLVPMANIPVMDILVNHIAQSGIKDVIANTYFKAEQIQNHYKVAPLNIMFIKETELSGTAGGLKKCQFFFEENTDFLVLSGDGLTDLDIAKAYESHKNSNAIATIVAKEVYKSEVSKYGIIVTNNDNSVKSFQEKPDILEAKSTLANTGIYIFNYKIFDFIPDNTFYDFAKNVFPSILNAGVKINTYKMDSYWSDIGSLEQYKQSNIDIMNMKVKSYIPDVIRLQNANIIKGTNCKISTDAKFEGNCIIGNNCEIEDNAKIENSLLWDNVIVKRNTVIKNSIVLSNIEIDYNAENQIISAISEEEKSKTSV